MLSDLIKYLGGNVPLGLLIIPYLGSIFSIIWWVSWSGTKFWSVRRFWKVMAMGWSILVMAYVVYWRLDPPAPIPTRVYVRAGDGIGTSPGAWAEGVADLIKTRLRVAEEPFVVQDGETAAMLAVAASPGRLDSLSYLLGIKYIIEVSEDPDSTVERPKVSISVKKRSGNRYKQRFLSPVPNVSLSSLGVWAAEAVAQQIGGSDLKGVWAGRPPALPDSLLEVHYLAFSVRRQGEYELAAALFMEEALADSGWSAPRLELARTRLESKSTEHGEEIRKSLLEAATIERENPETYILLGRYFLESRDWEEAESALKLGYIFDSEDPRIYFYLSRLTETRLGDLPIKDSRRLVERALYLAPGYHAARLDLVEKMRAGNQKRAAIRILKDGLRFVPDSRPLLVTTSAVYLDMHKYEEAAEYCNRLLQITPNDHEALYNLGLCRMWLKDYDTALALFDSSRKNGGTVENLYYSGITSQYKKDYPAAIEWFQRRFAAASGADDKGAGAARARISQIRDWMFQDSLKKAGWKPENPFDNPPTIKEFRDGK